MLRSLVGYQTSNLPAPALEKSIVDLPTSAVAMRSVKRDPDRLGILINGAMFLDGMRFQCLAGNTTRVVRAQRHQGLIGVARYREVISLRERFPLSHRRGS